MKTELIRSRSIAFLAALLATGAAAGCHHHQRGENIVLNPEALAALISQQRGESIVLSPEVIAMLMSRQNRVCLDEYIWAQTPQHVDAQGHLHPSTFLFSARLINGRSEPAVGPLRLRMTVAGGGHNGTSAPPHVELPAATRIPPRGAIRTPVLVTIPAVDGQAYTIDVTLWEPDAPDGGDGSYCQHRTFTIPAVAPMG